MEQYKRLPEQLKRNGILYNMVDRTESAVLWELFLKKTRVGYEVSQIHFRPEKFIFGKHFKAREALPSDSAFAAFDKSKCFFPGELERATDYLRELTAGLLLKDLVNTPSKEISIDK
jgi:hypothetical protein